MLTSAQLAARIGCSRDTISRIAREQKIGTKIGRDWLFSEADAAKLAALVRPGPGSPVFTEGNDLWKRRCKKKRTAKPRRK